MTEEKETKQEDNAPNLDAMAKFLVDSGAIPIPEEKHNVHTFLFNVAREKDTTKLGFLKSEEIGAAMHPIRALKEFSLISEDIIGNEFFSDYFSKESEIITSTSLSREGFLAKLAVTTTRQIADVTKPKTENKSWFKKKENTDSPNPS